MEIEEMLATGSVQDIDSFIKACEFPSDAFVLVECLPRQVIADARERQELLRFARLRDDINLSLYTSGRVFQQGFELRWEWEPQGTRVVYLGQTRDLPELQAEKKHNQWQVGLAPHERSYYLFGEYLSPKRLEQMGLQQSDFPEGQGYYAEVRIPRLLQYPIQAQRVQLVVREYVEKTTGRVQLFRFLNLKRVEG